MELFYAYDIDGGIVRLDEEESGHCVRVLRHRIGDEISVIDGRGTLMRCRVVSDRPKAVEAEVISSVCGWNALPYRLTMAVCPTKNIDRYEWFAEKATEMGVGVIVPVVGEHSERRVLKTQRLEKIVLSAAKQSLKGAVPSVAAPVSVRDFILGCSAGTAADIPGSVFGRGSDDVLENASGSTSDGVSGNAGGSVSDSATSSLKLIACCFEDAEHPRRSVREALADWLGTRFPSLAEAKVEAYEENSVPGPRRPDGDIPEITVLIGPEGDFSADELRVALEHGYIPVHLGPSRLRTETAALLCVEAVYSALTL